jgi:hypothetical protein
MVDPERFLSLVQGIQDKTFAMYPNLTRQAVQDAVGGFVDSLTD